jgi:uncharacterized protein YkwD
LCFKTRIGILWHLIQPVKSDKVNLRFEQDFILSIVKGECDLEKRSLVRGSVLLVLWIASAAGIFWGWPAWAAAEVSEPAQSAQYLPLIITTDCVPGPLILPDDLDKDFAVEEKINAIRVDRGLPVLANAQKITQAALRHSNDMADNDFFSHTGSDGSRAGQRLDETCYKWQAYGEIIAAGYGGNPGTVIEAWMKSPGHTSIILSDVYTEFGAGYAYNSSSNYKHYFTVVFGLGYRSTTDEYYSCTYYMGDENGESWLSIYSDTPCGNVTQVPPGSIGRR